MYVVRDVFKAKSGKAKQLVQLFKEAEPYFLTKGVSKIRILTDVVSNYWTVVWEFEVNEINDYFEMSKNIDSNSDLFVALEGYKDHVDEGHREIFRLE